MRRSWIILPLLLGVTVVGWRLHERRAAARQGAVERSLLRTWVLTQTDVGRSAPEAGISLERRDVRTLDAGRRKALAGFPGFGSYQHRCQSCHGLPDPTVHQPSEWSGVVDRMGRHMKAAGLLPLSSEDRAGIVEFLETASEKR
ncbi:MAG: cytochrome c [Gemmatimonadota bacterium]